ncbi:hypothetical protein D3C87_124800 [compost metagenome]
MVLMVNALNLQSGALAIQPCHRVEEPKLRLSSFLVNVLSQQPNLFKASNGK